MTDTQALAFRNSFLDTRKFAAAALTIRDKTGATVPLQFSPAQIKLHTCIAKQEAAAKPVRGIILKPRRVHISVGCAANIFHRTPFFPGRKAAVISYLEKSSAENYDYYQQFERSYRAGPGYLGVGLPELFSSRKTGMEWSNNSSVTLGTAESMETGRGFQFHALHLTEYAFWPNAERLMTALKPTVADMPGTMILIESTANGMGGDFWQRWQDARTNPDWFAMFFAWHEHPEYRDTMAPEEMGRFQDAMSLEDRNYQIQYGLSTQQMSWRARQIRELKSIDKFRQEYPSNAEEAFLMSGRPRFDVVTLGRHPIVPKPVMGTLEVQQIGVGRKPVFYPREDGSGPLAVYRRPEPHSRYVIGGDAASGIERETGDPDYSVACALDVDTGEQCALFRLRISPGQFAEALYLIGWWFNWAMLVPERNRDGMAVIEKLCDMQYPIDRIYCDTGRMPSDRRQPMLQDLGYNTTPVSRPNLISKLDDALRTAAITVRDTVTMTELRAFGYRKDGKVEGLGCHDDTVFALALAVEGIENAARIIPRFTADRLRDRREDEDSGPVLWGHGFRKARR